ncbi:hypothetical protein Dimus_028793 [Dionaea muscipula]
MRKGGKHGQRKKIMICKFQCIIDYSSLQAFSSIKTSSNAAVPVSPPGKNGESNKILANPDGAFQRNRRFHTLSQSSSRNHRPVLEKQQSSSRHLEFSDNQDRGQSNNGSVRLGHQGKNNGPVRSRSGMKRMLKIEKVPAKCSTKCLSYGGCIPSILRALDTVRDLDEAFRPWEETLTNKERSIILKEQSSWERAREIFEWFKRKGCYELNVIHYNIMIKILGKARKWEEVESLWDEMRAKKIDPTNSTFGTLIDVYSKAGKREEARLWLRIMNEMGLEPDEMTMAIVVQMYKKAGEFKKAEQFFKNWSSGNSMKEEKEAEAKSRKIHGASTTSDSTGAQLALSLCTYNTLIDTYGKAGQLQEAYETFNLMLRNGVVPDTITFNTLIHAFGNSAQLEEVDSIMQKMEELQCPPDTRTFNILISLHTKHNDIDKAVGYFLRMKEAGLEPDFVSYRTLLFAFSTRHMVDEAEKLIIEIDNRGLQIDEFSQSALTRMYVEAGMLEKSWLWFQRFNAEGKMSSECYSANIDAYGEHGHVVEAEKAFDSCKEMKKLGVVEFNVMIKAYLIGQRYDKACKLFDSMESEGVMPDRCSYVYLIQMLAGADLPHIAKRYLLKMQEAGLTIDCVSYCAVISSFARLGQLENAKGLYEAMLGNDVEADIIVYGVLINAFAEIGDAKEALVYVDAMRKAGLPMNSVICNSLIKLFTKLGYLQEAEETYKLLQSLEEGGPDLYSSNCMIDLYSERSMVKEAQVMFDDMQKRGYANEFSFARMLCLYKRTGRLEEAMRIGKKMRELGLFSELLSYNSMISLLVLSGKFREAVEILKEMIELAIQPDDSTFKSLGAVLVYSGVPKHAVGQLEVAWKKDAQSGTQAWISLLSSVVNEGVY